MTPLEHDPSVTYPDITFDHDGPHGFGAWWCVAQLRLNIMKIGIRYIGIADNAIILDGHCLHAHDACSVQKTVSANFQLAVGMQPDVHQTTARSDMNLARAE
jgi:hypothetical protein